MAGFPTVSAVRKGSELTILADGSSALTVSADKETVAEIWNNALTEMLSLKPALLNDPTSNVERLTCTIVLHVASITATAG